MLANVAAHNSMEEDGEIRPSQIDEFIEVRAALKKQMNDQLGFVPGPQSSYITIGDDDPFITGKFCEASSKQFDFVH